MCGCYREEDIVPEKVLAGGTYARWKEPEKIGGQGWRSSWLLCVPDPIALWKIKLIPKGVVRIEPDGTIQAEDVTAAQRTALLDYDSLIVDAYQFENLWPKRQEIADNKRREWLQEAAQRGLDQDEIQWLS